MASNDENKANEANSLFVIDTQGDEPVHDKPVEEDKPVKKLKRRNAAMYATEWFLLLLGPMIIFWYMVINMIEREIKKYVVVSNAYDCQLQRCCSVKEQN